MMADPLNHDVILSKVQDTINAEIKTGLTLSRENHALAENFKERHGSILKELNTIGHFTRKVAMLIQDEKHKLLQSCKNFADRWPRAYPYHRMMTPKGHILTHHLPHYVQHWGTIGLFGEDGLESLHCRYAKFQRSAASLPNTRESMLCTHDHLNLSQYFPATRPEPTTTSMQRSELSLLLDHSRRPFDWSAVPGAADFDSAELRADAGADVAVAWTQNPGEKARRIWEWWRARLVKNDVFTFFKLAIRLVVLVQASSAAVERANSRLKRIFDVLGENAPTDLIEYRLFRALNH